jgi:hypothetical protein
MLGLGVALLRQFFGDSERIALEKSKYLWAENQESSQLYIGHQDNLDFQTIGKRPAVIVSVGPMTFPKEVIADRMETELETGGIAFLDYNRGTWNFTCLADKSLDALGMAGEIKYFFQTYRRFIAQSYSMQFLRVVEIGAYQKQKEFKDMYGCQVSVAFEVQDNFEVVPEALRVSAIRLQLTEE